MHEIGFIYLFVTLDLLCLLFHLLMIQEIKAVLKVLNLCFCPTASKTLSNSVYLSEKLLRLEIKFSFLQQYFGLASSKKSILIKDRHYFLKLIQFDNERVYLAVFSFDKSPSETLIKTDSTYLHSHCNTKKNTNIEKERKMVFSRLLRVFAKDYSAVHIRITKTPFMQ